MTKVFAALAVSVDGFIADREGGTPDAGAGSVRVLDHTIARTGAVVAGRRTYDTGIPNSLADYPLLVLTHRPIPDAAPAHTVVTSGVGDAIAAARDLAGTKDVALMGGELLTAALRAGLVDELVLHQVAVLLGGGRRLFGELPEHVRLEPIEITPADGVTHLRYRVRRP